MTKKDNGAAPEVLNSKPVPEPEVRPFHRKKQAPLPACKRIGQSPEVLASSAQVSRRPADSSQGGEIVSPQAGLHPAGGSSDKIEGRHEGTEIQEIPLAIEDHHSFFTGVGFLTEPTLGSGMDADIRRRQ